MQTSKLNHEIRRQRALQRLGSDNPRCFRCGINNPHCLELHHIAGQAYDGRTVIACRNCHRALSDAQRDHPEHMADVPSILETIGRFLLGIADLFMLLIDGLREYGHLLIDYARAEVAKV